MLHVHLRRAYFISSLGVAFYKCQLIKSVDSFIHIINIFIAAVVHFQLMTTCHTKSFVNHTLIISSPVKICLRDFSMKAQMWAEERAGPTEVWTSCYCNFLGLLGDTPSKYIQAEHEMLSCIIYILNWSHNFSVPNFFQCPVVRCSKQELCLNRRMIFQNMACICSRILSLSCDFPIKAATVFIEHLNFTGSAGSWRQKWKSYLNFSFYFPERLFSSRFHQKLTHLQFIQKCDKYCFQILWSFPTEYKRQKHVVHLRSEIMTCGRPFYYPLPQTLQWSDRPWIF